MNSQLDEGKKNFLHMIMVGWIFDEMPECLENPMVVSHVITGFLTGFLNVQF